MSNSRLSNRFQSAQAQPRLSRHKLYAAMLVASQWMVAGQLWAAPEGGEVVGGAGVIEQNGVDTMIHQSTERMAIDWRSFDVASNERVEFIQPSSSSIALNRVLSNRGSEILGRIDANGQVMLVNPNGVVFGKDSIINVGGMIASGLNIDPTSFINGDFALNSMEGTDGKVINYGIINAATGGSVTLVGQQVQNDGLISAKLGAVNLAAGNEAVLTFDQSGLVGVKVTEAVLQNELGVDAAVINSGEINAEGGRVLLSASVSKDIFSNAVNNGGMNKASSVVMHDDGSFTLGSGADVINTGEINTSVTSGSAGQVVVVGNNITNSGTVSADTSAGVAGTIELHSTDTTLVTASGNISAKTTTQGEGGDIKILGNKVGLFDSAQVDASGANGGGQVLIGGDKTGQNKKIRNADFIYLGEHTNVKTDALIDGNGGKLITFASDTTRIYGNLYSRGGSEGGNGGFIETSGLKGFEILNTPDITAEAGSGGAWLIDPYNIVINGGGRRITPSNDGKTFTSNNDGAELNITTLTGALKNGAEVIVQTGGSTTEGNNQGNITLNEVLNFTDNATLRLLAHNNIILTKNIQKVAAADNGNIEVTGALNLELIANKDNVGGGLVGGEIGNSIIVANGVTIATNGGYFYAGKSAGEDNGRLGSDYTNKVFNFTSTGATINTSNDFGGGDVVINVTNNVELGAVSFKHFYKNAQSADGGGLNGGDNLSQVGSILINSGGNVTLNSEIDFNDTGRRQGDTGNDGYPSDSLDNEEAFLTINANGDITIKERILDKDFGDYRDALNITLAADKDHLNGGTIKINKDIYTAGGNFIASAAIFDSTGTIINTDRANERTNDGASGTHHGNAQWSNGGNVDISARNSIVLGSITTDGICGASVECNGNFTLSSIDSDAAAPGAQLTATVTQAAGSVLTVAGETEINVGSGTVDLTKDNSFNKKITVTSAKDVLLKDADAAKGLLFGATTVSGKMELSAAGYIAFKNDSDVAQDINAASFKVLDAKFFTSGNITTTGGNVDINAADSISVDSIDTSATAAGIIALTVDGTDATKKIVINGKLKSQSTIDLTLADSSALGTVTFASTSSLPSNIKVTGSGEADTINVLDGNNTWSLTAADSGALYNTADGNSKSIEFSGFESVVGGAGVDIFDIDFAGLLTVVNGGEGNDEFNIKASTTNAILNGGEGKDTFNVVALGPVVATLTGGDGDEDKLNLNSAGIAYSVVVANEFTSGSISINGIESLLGNNHANTSLKVASGNNIWSVTGTDNGTINEGSAAEVVFENIKKLIGGAGDDNFVFQADGFITGSIDGGSGTNSITARTANTTWSIEAENSGSLALTESPSTKYLNGFSAIQNLIGTTANDTFSFKNGAKVSSADGKGGTDTADLSQISTEITVTLGSASEYGFTDVDRIVGNATTNSTFSSGSGNDTWIIDNSDGVNDGEVGGIKFVGFKNLAGGDGADIFNISNDFAGNIFGGDGADEFNIDAQVANVSGGAGADEFNINARTGNISGGAGADIFNIKALVDNISGGDDNDRFVFFSTGSVTNASGEAGDDIVDLSNIAEDRSIILNGTTINGVADVATVIANNAYNFTLSAVSGANTWRVYDFDAGGNISDGVNDGTVAGINFVNFKHLVGGDGVDTFTIDRNFTGTISGGLSADQFNINAQVNTILGGDGDDRFVFSNAGSVTNASGEDGDDIVDLSNIAADRSIILDGTTINGVSNVATVIANDAFNFTLSTVSGANTWRVYDFDAGGNISDGVNDGTVAGINFVNFKHLVGGDGVDTFTIDRNFTGTISGGLGADRFNINAQVNSILGGEGDDRFIFSNAGSVTSASGEDGVDIVDLSNITTDRTINLNGTAINGVSDVATVIANDAYNFTLSAVSGTNTWRVYDFDVGGNISDGVNDGTVAGINFVDFKNLIGGDGVDTFTIDTNFTGAISGGLGADRFNINAQVNSILGGEGNDRFVFSSVGSVTSASGEAGDDIVDLSNIAEDRSITLNGTIINGVSDVATVIANNAYNFTLSAVSGANTWRVYDFDAGGNISDGVNDGTVAGINFVNFKNLVGGDGADVFTIDTNFTGTISGGLGTDQFNINAQVDTILGGAGNDRFVFSNAGSVTNASGEDGDDIVDLSNIAADRSIILDGTIINGVSNVATVIANDAFNFTLSTVSGANTWRVYDFDAGGNISDGVNDGTVAGINFVNFKHLVGGDGVDTFTIDRNFTGTISGGLGADRFNINAQVNTILGGGGDDRFVFSNTGSVTSASGETGDDIVDLSGITTDRTISLEGTAINGVSDVATVIGNDAYNFTLSAVSGTNIWRVYDFDVGGNISDGVNDGTVAGINFVDFKNLIGGDGVDTFTIDTNFTGTISGGLGADRFNINAQVNSILGGGGNDRFVFSGAGSVASASGEDGVDIVDLSNIAADRSITLDGTTINGVSDVATVIANNAYNFTLSAVSGANTWRVYDFDAGGNISDGVNDGTAAGINFVDFKGLTGGIDADIFQIDTTFAGILSGGDGDDSFIFGNSGSAVSINGGLGTNELTGRNSTNTWTMIADNIGSVTANGAAYVNSFSNIQNLQGGSAVDNFNFSFAFAGTVKGGAGNDIFNIGAITHVLQGETGDDSFIFSGASNAVSATSIDGGAANESNSLTGRDADNDWNITQENTGTLSSGGYVTAFSNIQILNGGAGADNFIINAAVSNAINAGAGSNSFTINAAVGNITGGDSDETFIFGIQGSANNLNGGGGNNTLVGRNGNNTWNTTGVNQGRLIATSGSTTYVNSFNNIQALRGGSSIDVFNINHNFTGAISGGAGSDTFNIDATTTDIFGEAGNDSFIFGNAGRASLINGGTDTNTLTARNGANTWATNAVNEGLISVTNGSSYLDRFLNIQILQGGNAIDIFDFNFNFSGTAKGSSGEDIFNVNAIVSVLEGGAGDDSFIFNSVANSGKATSIDGGDGINGLIGRDADNTWKITRENGGVLAAADGIYVAGFDNIQILNGGIAADTFEIGATISREINSGNGNNIFKVNTAVNNLLGGADNDQFIFGTLGSAQSINGAGGNNSLTGRDAENFWNITGNNAGNIQINNTLYLANFTNIQSLHGGANVDVFNISAAAGNLFGNAGNDRFLFDNSNNGSAISIDGGAGSNSLRGRNVENSWTMISANAGTLSSIIGDVYVSSFSSVQNLEGGNASDTLYAANQNNDWSITANNSGNLKAPNAAATAQVVFTNIESLVGAQGQDKFTFTTNQSYITGLIDGGTSASADSVDLSAITGGITVELGNAVSNNLNIVNIESLAANADNPNGNVLIGASDTAYRWAITGLNSGSIQAANSATEPSISFTNFGVLRGGTNDDTFKVTGLGKAISVDGGTGRDWVDYSETVGDVPITLDDSDSLGRTRVTDVEGVIGNNNGTGIYNSSIKVTNGNSEWNIINDNSGTVTADGKTISFENFNQLIGGTGNDKFIYKEQGRLIGLIDGGAGSNTIDASGSSKAQQFHLNGNTAGVTNLIGIASITGNASTNSALVSTATANTWTVDNQGKGTLNGGLTFTSIANLTGGAFKDVFTLSSVAPFGGIIDGGAGADEVDLTGVAADISVGIGATAIANLKANSIELIKANAVRKNTLVADNLIDNAWLISSENTGTLNTSIGFTGFANLMGRETVDTFTFTNEASNITGWIDAGAGIDRLNLTNSNRNLVVRLTSVNDVINSNEITINNVELVDADADNTNKLIAKDVDNIWDITSINGGSLYDGISPLITFTNFKNLVGGNQNDLFNIGSTGSITGQIDGGAQRDRDVVDVSKASNANVVISTATGGYTNIEKYIGNNTTSTITADNVINNWTVINNGGTLNNNIEFEQFVNLVGGSNQDTFNLNNANLSGYIDGADGSDSFNLVGSVTTGEIRGGAGDDEFRITVMSGLAGITNLRGGSGLNRLLVTGGDANYKATHQLGVLQYADIANTVYTSNYSEIAEVTDNVMADSLTIWGTSAVDTFRLQNNRYQLEPTLFINYSEKQNLNINGSSTDFVSLSGSVIVPKTLTVNNAAITTENGGKLIAENLELVATQAVGSAANRLQLEVNNLYLKSTNGNVYINEQDSLDIKEFSSSTMGIFDVTVGGSLVASSDINYTGDFNVDSQRGNITIGNSNIFAGNLNLKAAGDIDIKSLSSLNLLGVNAQNLKIDSAGDIKALGPIVVSGTTNLSTKANINFASANNDINELRVAAANDVVLSDSNNINIMGISAAGTVSVDAGGGISIGASCVGGCVEQVNVTSGNSLRITAIDDIQMANTATAESVSGNVIFTGKNISLSTIKAVNGEVKTTAAGAITDNNDSATNIYAKRWVANALSGIGSGSADLSINKNAIETEIGILSARNAGKILGDTSINIVNSGELTIEQLRNNGDISIANLTGDIILDNTAENPLELNNEGRLNGGVASNKLSDAYGADLASNGMFNPDNSDARDQGGIINANTGALGGTLTLTIPNGMVRALGKHNAENPDIIANIASFNYPKNTRFSFGERSRKIVMNIPDVYNQTAKTSSVIWYKGRKPRTIVDSSKALSELDSMINDQLIQIEGLNEIDPAIFTSVSNYIHDEVAILMPVDQRFDDDEYAE